MALISGISPEVSRSETRAFVWMTRMALDKVGRGSAEFGANFTVDNPFSLPSWILNRRWEGESSFSYVCMLDITMAKTAVDAPAALPPDYVVVTAVHEPMSSSENCWLAQSSDGLDEFLGAALLF
ncbi:unnamed protein product [Heligmosomoides polygyrus]|uniref:Dynein_AAA_lid domain-containing protein n=1 Tax=Heligmosomoides polygyrus TaxID=6339 RepID=A0A183G183_HELPZ|nr:unnamed protein product [Heligmosomoides polygyrus]